MVELTNLIMSKNIIEIQDFFSRLLLAPIGHEMCTEKVQNLDYVIWMGTRQTCHKPHTKH